MASHQLTQEQIEVLADIVGSEEKVREWHKEFLQEYPNGEVSKEGLAKEFNQLFPGGNFDKFIGFAFKAFDTNNDGKLSFEEFLIGTMLFMNEGTKLSKQAKQRQVDLFFKLFDTNGDGKISVEELKKVLSAFISISSSGDDDPTAELFSEIQSNEILEKLGSGSDSLTKAELAKALKNIDGIQLFSDFDEE